MKVIYSSDAGSWVTTPTKKTLLERLFTLPWQPWKSMKSVRHFEPASYIVSKGTPQEVLVAHPSLKHQIEKEK